METTQLQEAARTDNQCHARSELDALCFTMLDEAMQSPEKIADMLDAIEFAERVVAIWHKSGADVLALGSAVDDLIMVEIKDVIAQRAKRALAVKKALDDVVRQIALGH